jgi:4-hydroxy-tetrahydrodipicolinate synthase
LSESFELAGVFSVLPTAFRGDGELDLDGTSALVRATADAGVSGLTVLGVMGEAAELSEEERHQVVSCVRTTTTLPIVVGVSGGSARIVSGRAEAAARSGVSAIMVSPSGTLALADAVTAAAAGGLPIIIQDYPAGSGVPIAAAELIAVVAEQPLVVGVKAEAPPTSGSIETLRAAHPRLGLVGGLGGLFLIDELRAGATGVMTGFAMPERLVSVVRTYPTDPDAATREWTRLLPLMRLEAFQPFSLAARKEVWRLRGVISSSYCRRPGARLDDRARDDVARALTAVSA